MDLPYKLFHASPMFFMGLEINRCTSKPVTKKNINIDVLKGILLYLAFMHADDFHIPMCGYFFGLRKRK